MAEKKQTPAIRFKGFGEVWCEMHLSEIATMKARIGWQGLTKKEYLDSGNFYLITGTDFLDGRIDFENCHYVDEDRYAQDTNIQIKNDDVLITKDGTIGKVAYVDNLDKPATLNAGVFVIRGKDKSICNLYLYQYLAAPFLLDFAYKQATGGTIKHLNQNVLVKFPVPISNVAEQTQIGGYFQHLDKLISLHQAKVNKLTNLKKAMLEKMFPKAGADVPEIRFKGFEGAWGECKLSDITDYKNGKGHEDRQLSSGRYELINLNSISIDGGLKPSGKFINETDTTLNKNDLVMVLSDVGHGDLLGRVALIPDNNKFVLNQRVALLRPRPNINSIFLFYNINAHQSYFKSQGAGMSQLNLSKSSVENFVSQVPDDDVEQEKIGSYFQNLDQLITLHQTELTKLGNLKKACLEKMFV